MGVVWGIWARAGGVGYRVGWVDRGDWARLGEGLGQAEGLDQGKD